MTAEAKTTMANEAIATTVAAAANYGGATAAIVSHGLSLPEWASIVSMSVAVAGFLLQAFVTWRKIRHERRQDAVWRYSDPIDDEG